MTHERAHDQDLDRWIGEITDDWRMPGPEEGPASWQDRLAGTHDVGPRGGVFGRVLGRVAAAAAVVAVTAVVGATGISLLGGPASPSDDPAARPGPVDRQRNDLFELTIGAARDRYAENEPIDITTSLRYIGGAPGTMVTGSGGGLVVFSVEQLDGPMDALAGRDADCARYEFRDGDVEEIPFEKSASWSSDDPMAPFWRAWVEDPLLRLPAGSYRITAEAEYGPPECGEPTTLAASITLEVGRATAVAPSQAADESPGQSAEPTGSTEPPPSDSVRDDLFELAISSDKASYAENEPVTVSTELRYIGEADEVTVTSSGHGIVIFSIEQLDGPVDAGGARTDDCAQYDFRRGDVDEVAFQKSGGWDGDDPMDEFWREFYSDPLLRLPAGTYRISAIAEYGPPECGHADSLQASTDIVVGDQPSATPPLAPESQRGTPTERADRDSLAAGPDGHARRRRQRHGIRRRLRADHRVTT